MNVKHILFPTDFSDGNDAALAYASLLAAESGGTLHILHVDDLQDVGADMAEFGYTCGTPWDYRDRAKVLDELEAVRPTVDGVPYEHHYRRGTAATQIVRFAESQAVDFVVMASHGRSGLARIVMGSVAEEVMRKAPCPVLIVKQPSSNQKPVETTCQ
jgi:nucleotide-binding universal stress UspA family protein